MVLKCVHELHTVITDDRPERPGQGRPDRPGGRPDVGSGDFGSGSEFNYAVAQQVVIQCVHE